METVRSVLAPGSLAGEEASCLPPRGTNWQAERDGDQVVLKLDHDAWLLRLRSAHEGFDFDPAVNRLTPRYLIDFLRNRQHRAMPIDPPTLPSAFPIATQWEANVADGKETRTVTWFTERTVTGTKSRELIAVDGEVLWEEQTT